MVPVSRPKYVIIIKQYGGEHAQYFDKYEDALEYYEYCEEEGLICTFRAIDHYLLDKD